MLRFLKRILGLSGSSPPSEGGARQRVQRTGAGHELANARERLSAAESGTREQARAMNRLADAHITAGDRDAGLRYYGSSIDAHMQLGEFDAATAICRKVLRLEPGVVRARCTLAWLSLGKGLIEMAREHVDEYVSAAREAGREEMAVQQLRLMAQYVEDPPFRSHLSRRLEELGDADGARTIDAEPGRSDSPGVRGVTWDPVVFAALLTPEELSEARAKGLDIRTPPPTRDDELPLYRPTED